MKRLVTLLMVLLLCSVLFAEGTAELTESDAGRKIPIRVLILPKLEVGEMSGDFPGEAQYFYDEYVKGGQEYEIWGAFEGNKLSLSNYLETLVIIAFLSGSTSPMPMSSPSGVPARQLSIR